MRGAGPCRRRTTDPVLHLPPYLLFARQGGLLSIATQEPNWSHSPSLLSSERLTAVEVCMGPGPADVERQIYSYTPPYLPFKRQGGLLRIAAQEPNLPRSPSVLGPVLVSGQG